MSVPAAVAVEVGTSEGERVAIRQAALDYIESFKTGDSPRLARSLHPDLAKRIVAFDATQGRDVLQQMSATQLVEMTGQVAAAPQPMDLTVTSVEVLDLYRNAATVKVVTSRWIDYIHIARFDGEWKIVNVLWVLTE
jgi:hypothetical protein